MTVSHAQLLNLAPQSIVVAENVRQGDGLDADSIAGLAESIQAFGILQPLVGRRVGKSVQLVAGHRRLLAAKLLDLATVPIVVQETPEAERLARQMAENIHRTDLSLNDQARAVRALYEEHHGLQLVADMLNKSKSWASKMLAISASPDGRDSTCARVLIEADQLTDLEMAYTLTQIERLDPARAAIEARQIMQHTRASLRDALARLKANQANNAKRDAEPTDEDNDEPADDREDQAPADPPRRFDLTCAEAEILHSAIEDFIKSGGADAHNETACISLKARLLAHWNP